MNRRYDDSNVVKDYNSNGVKILMPHMEDIFNSDEDEDEDPDFQTERDFTELTDRIRKESDKKRRGPKDYT